MSDTSYEHKIIAAAMRMEAAWSEAANMGPIDANLSEFRAAVEEIVQAVRGMRKRRKEDAAELLEERLREDPRIVYELDDPADHATAPTEPPPRRDKREN